MDDTAYGIRDSRGFWRPFKRIEYPPVFVWPAEPRGIVKWLVGYPGYLFPWNAFYAVLAVLVWFFATPSLEEMRSFSPGWILFILARNLALILLFFGAFHLRLYIRKAQGTQFKYDAKWLETSSPRFLFGNQTIDKMIWTLGSGLPIWTAYEVLTLWLFANGYIPFVAVDQHPLYFVLLLLAIPLFRELHFYIVHRLIHWPPLYRSVHKLHHNNVNPGPWSGLAMHPVEHLLYFSGILLHWIIPSHPLHALYHIIHAGLTPAPGHVGFDRVAIGDDASVDTESYAHYLHHRYFECNYADGTLPLDKWFGTFHDGSEEAHRAINHCRAARRQESPTRSP
jgi:sterol desaturase/sphingolipid hydroxylase (fatty acid hydroxylase superfamily)